MPLQGGQCLCHRGGAARRTICDLAGSRTCRSINPSIIRRPGSLFGDSAEALHYFHNHNHCGSHDTFTAKSTATAVAVLAVALRAAASDKVHTSGCRQILHVAVPGDSEHGVAHTAAGGVAEMAHGPRPEEPFLIFQDPTSIRNFSDMPKKVP